jgi:hypothetical protein
MTLSALGIFSAAGAGGGAVGDYELIQTQILTGTEASITFSSLATYASTYKHLQIRHAARSNAAFNTLGVFSRLNGDSGGNYASHSLTGTGSSVVSGALTSQTQARAGMAAGSTVTANAFGAGVIDLLDAYSTTKYKTFRTLSGNTGGTRIDLHSGLWMNTASVTSWELLLDDGSFIAGSRFSLYGIRG